MKFWTYMLHCSDRSFYVGHTDDLDRRIGQHEQGLIPGNTSARLPVKLVWTENFATREEARESETRLKGWSRAKKLALIRNDWVTISGLAKGKERASTSSAKSGSGAERFLHPHPKQLPSEPLNLEVKVRADAEHLTLRYRLTGRMEHIDVPPLASSTRQDGLWRHTCFEAFALLDEGPAYLEFNFSPSGEWAAYSFDETRVGMREFAMDPPRLRHAHGRYVLELTAVVPIAPLLAFTRLGLSAVIEETDGRKSYWALAHPPGPPDFHHPDCFTLELASPSAP